MSNKYWTNKTDNEDIISATDFNNAFGGIASDIDELKGDLSKIITVEKSPNLINPENWKNGYRCISGDTMLDGSANERCKYYYLGEFNEGDTLVFGGMVASNVAAISYGHKNTGKCAGTYRHSSSDFYETSLDGVKMYTYTVTENTLVGFYVGISNSLSYVALKSEYDKTHKTFEYGESTVDFLGNVKTDNVEDNAVTIEKIEPEVSNKITTLLESRDVIAEWEEGYYWTTIKVTNASFAVSNPILLHCGETIEYYARFATTNGNFASQVDRNGIHIRSLMSAPNGYATFKYTATLDDEYIIFSKNKSCADDYIKIYKTKDNDIRVTEEQLSKNDFYKYLFDKVTCVGDSLTAGYYGDAVVRKNGSYPSFLAKMTGWNVVNEGSSGASATSWYNGHQSVDFSDSDAVFICLGTNQGLPDTVGQNLGDHTDYYCRIIDKILAENSDCKIFLFTVQGSSTVSTDVTNATIGKIAERYANNKVALCDWRNNPYFYMKGQSGGGSNVEYHTSSTEGTHFGRIGYLTMARVFLSLAMHHIDTHKSDYELPYEVN